MEQLIPKRSIYSTLGTLCVKPALLLNENYKLNVEDFGEQFYKIIYSAVNNIIVQNPAIEKITGVDIDNLIAQNPQLYKIYELNGGLEFVESAIANANIDTYEMNYKQIKKYSVLRDFGANGFDISTILDVHNTDLNKRTSQLEELDKMSIDDIVNHFTLKLVRVQDRWQTGSHKKSYVISEGLDDLLADLQKSPEYGYPFASTFHNAIFRGQLKGRFYLRSGNSGNGKTTYALADMAKVACTELYDIKQNKYVTNGQAHACCFISTELDIRQVQLSLLSIISKVNKNVIKNGNYSPDIEMRLNKAIRILKESPIYLHYLPEYNIADIRQTIEKDILQNNVEYVWHDYIMFNPRLAKEAQEKYGYAIREDLVLVDLSANLKQIAEKYNIFIASSTQLNRSSSDRDQRNANSLRGSSAILDKVDMASMIFSTTEKDLNDVEHIIKNGMYPKINAMEYVIKNREGESGLIIWYKRNLSNMEIEPCFVTNLNFELQTHIEPLELVFNEE